jgi:predicted glycoside hydrolase/deacetylase ChbG (UPF0249 family)
MDSLAIRLGFEAHERIAIVHVDDLGMCHAANVGGFEALTNGPATCGSIMVPCPWFQEAAEMAQRRPELDLGVHLTLNSEWAHYRWGPVAGRSAVPSLLDAQGYLPRTVAELAGKAETAHVEIELRAQIEQALAAGLALTHLDSHMGACFLPQVVDVYRRLGEEYRLPVFAPRAEPEALEAAELGAAAEPVLRAFSALEAGGMPILDGFDANSLHFAEGEGEDHNARRLAGLRPGVSYLICHAAQDGDELRRITPDSAYQRDFERRFYGGETGAEALRAAGVRTLGMRPLAELVPVS